MIHDVDLQRLVYASWAMKREEEATTMGSKRRLTEKEIDRAMVIGKSFVGWSEETGPCPIKPETGYWGKKLCAMFEWVSVLESDVERLRNEAWIWRIVALVELAMVFAMCWLVAHK